MKTAPLDIDFEAELAAHHARRGNRRSAGRHLSSIIHYIINKLEPERFGNAPPEMTLVHQGFIWEDVFSRVLAEQLSGAKSQFEIEEDGIFMTPDAFSIKRWRVIEMKMTKISARHDLASNVFWHWHAQIKGYCRALDTLEAELVPLHVNGSYELAGGRFGKSVARPTLVSYTAREIEENWECILRTRDRMDREGV